MACKDTLWSWSTIPMSSPCRFATSEGPARLELNLFTKACQRKWAIDLITAEHTKRPPPRWIASINAARMPPSPIFGIILLLTLTRLPVVLVHVLVQLLTPLNRVNIHRHLLTCLKLMKEKLYKEVWLVRPIYLRLVPLVFLKTVRQLPGLRKLHSLASLRQGTTP